MNKEEREKKREGEKAEEGEENWKEEKIRNRSTLS